MLLQAACLFFTLKVSSTDYQDLVDEVGNTLDECIGILGHIGRYVYEVNLLQDVSRRAEDENDNVDTDVKLGACVSILKAVDTYREEHMRLVRWQNLLRFEEKVYLDELLKPLSQKMGDGFYVASVDGDEISDFRTACDTQSPILIIVETTNGTVFGGYSGHNDKGCTSDDWQSSSDAFLFRLRPSFGQYAIRLEGVAFRMQPSYLTFGYMLNIHDHALNNTNVLHTSGGQYEGDYGELNDGEMFFRAKEWVAMKVEDL